MTKSICLVAGLLLSLFVNAQQFSEKSKRFGYGLRSGANFSTFHVAKGKILYSETKPNKGRTSYNIGAFFSWNLDTKSKVICELSYSKKGGDIKNIVGPYQGITEYRMDYLSIPVLMRYQVISKVFVELGPEFSFVIHQNGRKKLDKRDYAAVAGAGYIINPRFSMNMRYDYGLKNISKYLREYHLGKWHNRTLQVSLSYTIGGAL